jgi:GTP pyrophosphokinase
VAFHDSDTGEPPELFARTLPHYRCNGRRVVRQEAPTSVLQAELDDGSDGSARSEPETRSRPFTGRLSDAFAYAASRHAGQVRKGTRIPYVAHLMGTCAIALEFGASEEEAIAALLHDAAEDTGGRPVLEEIRARFGSRVAEIVEGCTDSFENPKPPWRPRKERYVAHLAGASPSVLLVSAADKLHNARAILADLRTHGEALWPRFNGGKEGTLWYYRALVEAFRKRGATPIVEELDRVVGELERLASTA